MAEFKEKRRSPSLSSENESIDTITGSANEDIQVNIFKRLPATSFASAACVSKSWNKICNLVLARPKFASAISTNPVHEDAVKEAVDKILSDPIRPHFAIASISSSFAVYRTARLLGEKLGSKTPILVTTAPGIIGRDAGSDEFREVKFGEYNYVGEDGLLHTSDVSTGIVLMVGYVPGLKVEAIPHIMPVYGQKSTDNFVAEIREYTTSVSGCASPMGIMLFGREGADQNSVIEKLDYAMPEETVIVGYERSHFWYRTTDFKRHFSELYYICDAVALVFARDKENHHATGKFEFCVALSEGVKAIGSNYKAASVTEHDASKYPWTSLSARSEGHIISIYDEFRYIGITKERTCSTENEEPDQLITSLVFHELIERDRDALVVDGLGIKTGDSFECYVPDRKTALASCQNVCTKLGRMKLDHNKQVVGGFIISSSKRGDAFFKRKNVDSFPFLENLPGIQFAGVFSDGEIARRVSGLIGRKSEKSIRGCSHVCSTIYLMVLYTPPPLDN